MRSCSISRPHPIADALRRRGPLARTTTAYRAFHGSAEGIPGLAVDRFNDVGVIHAESAELLTRWLPTLQAELPQLTTAYAKIHPRGAVHLVDAPPLERPVWGPPVEELTVVEAGVRFRVRPAAGPSVGLFLDMREVRGWLRGMSARRSVLNLFAYTCAFGVSASLGGAARVLNLDLSRPYLQWGEANYELNGLTVDSRDFVFGDAFDWLARFARRKTRFDVVVVDPPSFSSTPFSVTRDYARLVEAAARTVSPAGILLAATNHASTSDERFDAWIRTGLSLAGRQSQILRRWHAPAADFPVATGHWPTLKVRALVLD